MTSSGSEREARPRLLSAVAGRQPVTNGRFDTDEIRRTHRVDELVARYGVELRRVGSALVGRCPFHNDQGRPNLHVYPRTGRWVCYRCGQRGDAIDFVQLIDSVTFREAAAQLQTSSSSFRPRHRVSRREPVAAASARTERTWGITEFRVLEAAVDLYANRL